jgi:predicted dehydrogenase
MNAMEKKRLKALIVGAGAMGRAWGQNVRDCEEVEVVGWVDLLPEAAARAAQELGFHSAYTGSHLDEALRKTRPDFVIDVTFPSAHYEVTMQALVAGVPVLGEKPMADTLGHAHEMVAASERSGKLFMVSQSRRYHPGLAALRQAIVDYLGTLGILNADFFIGAHFGGFREEMASPLLMDMAIHTFDAARYLSAADPVAVYCEEFNPPWSWYRGAACASAIFEMTEGLRFTYRGSWCSEGQHTAWEAEWRAVGSSGTVIWNGSGAPVAEHVVEQGGFHAKTERHETIVATASAVGIAGALRDFLHALRTGETPMGECHDNIKSLAMVLGAVESAALKQRIPIIF